MGTTPQAPRLSEVFRLRNSSPRWSSPTSHVSDLIFSPGRAPQIEVSGELVELKFKGLEMLTAEDTKLIYYDLIPVRTTIRFENWSRTGRRTFRMVFPASRDSA